MSGLSNYAKRMGILSARIFGEVARPTNSKSMKVVKMYAEKPVEMRSEVVNYYPVLPKFNSLVIRLRHLGLFRSEKHSCCSIWPKVSYHLTSFYFVFKFRVNQIS